MADSGVFTVRIDGLDKLTALFRQAPQLVEGTMQQAINKSAAVLASHTDPSTVPWRTGTLARSFNPAAISRLQARWFPRVNYARAVEFGMPSSPGRFVPAIGRRLKNGPNIGTWPGFSGRHYMEKIRAASEPDIDQLFRNALREVTRVLAGGSPSDTQGGLVNLMSPGASSAGISGTTSAFSSALYKLAPKLGSKVDQLTYRPFKGAPRGYQARLGRSFPRLFKRWNL